MDKPIYMEMAGQKKTERDMARLNFGAGEADAVPEMLMPFLFLTSPHS